MSLLLENALKRSFLSENIEQIKMKYLEKNL